MKIYYINGYKGENSEKSHEFEKMLGVNIQHVVYKYGETKYEDIVEKVKDADLIIGSSTGAYIARSICESYNITLISLNPVINLENTFAKLNVKEPILPKPKFSKLSELVLLNKDDELIDYKEALSLFKNQCKVFEKGGHRFLNLKQTKEDVLEFIKYLFFS